MTKRQSIFIIAMTYLSLFGLGLTDNLRGSLFPEILKTFALTNTQGAWFFILTSSFAVLAGYSTHAISQKFSTLSVLKTGVVFMGLGALLIYMASQFSFLLIGCAVLGIGFGFLGVTQNVIITEVTSPPITKKVLSGLHSMYGFASFLSPLLVSTFAIQSISWRYLFLGASLIIFLIAIGALTLSAPLPSKDNVFKKPPRERGIFIVESEKMFFATILSSYVAMELLISTRLTTYLTVTYQWPLEWASNYLTYFFIALLLGRLLFSFFHPPISTKKTLLISLMGSLLLIAFGLRIDPLYLSLSGFFMAPFYPLAMALLAELFPQKISSTVSLSISMQSAFVILMNLLIGILSDHYGIATAMYASLFFGGLSWFLLMRLPSKEVAHHNQIR